MITADVQGLTPGAEISLFEVDAVALGVGTLRFHGYLKAGSIWWQGQEFAPWPIEAEGFARTSDRPPTPTLKVGNIDGTISALTMSYADMVGAKVTRHRTLVKYLDAVNFPGGVNPDADPGEQFPPEIWFIERKAGEESDQIMFELVGYDLNGVKLPRRQVIPNYCPWGYRSVECGYTGPPVAKADDTPTADPALDRCSKRTTGCKIRFGQDGELPFGGFPAAGLMR